MKRYLLSMAATADIEGIASFLDDYALHPIAPVLEGLRDAMRRIATNPRTGRLRRDLADEPLRSHGAWCYIVVYRPSSPVEIVRVLHGTRDVARELGRKRRRS